MKKNLWLISIASCLLASCGGSSTPSGSNLSSINIASSETSSSVEEEDDKELIYVTNEENFTYKHVDGGLEVTGLSSIGYRRKLTDLVIPSSFEGYPVISIGERAFEFGLLKTLEVPEGIVEIKSKAFFGQSNFRQINLPNSLRIIGDHVFLLSNLFPGRFFFPDGIEEIGEDAVSYVDTTKYIKASNCYYIGSQNNQYFACMRESFAYDYEYYYSVRSETKIIAAGAFKDSKYVTHVFKNDEEPLIICDNAFANSAVIEVNVTNLQIIGNSAFANSKLEKLEASGIGEIKDSAFANCESLSQISYDNLGSIGEDILLDCPNFVFDTRNGCDYLKNNNSSSFILYKLNTERTLEFNGSFVAECERIAARAFESSAITEVEIPETIKEIGNRAFYKSELKSISLPLGLTKIDDEAFASSKLKSIIVPYTVTYLGSNVFGNTSINNVTLSKYVTHIGFPFFKNMESIEKFSIDEANETYKVLNGIIYSYSKDILFEATKVADLSLVSSIDDKVKIIYDHAFQSVGLSSILLPFNLLSIGDYAFEGNKDLSEIDFQPHLRYIGKNSFSRTNLTSLKVSGNVGRIFNGYFDGLSEVTSLVLEEGIARVDEEAFAPLKELKEISLPKSLVDIGLNSSKLSSLVKLETISYNGKVKDWYRSGMDANSLSNTQARVITCLDGYVKID